MAVLILSSCSSSEPLISEEEEEKMSQMDRDEIAEYLREELDETEYLLFENRSFLSDRFSTLQHDMPESYLKEVVQEERVIDERVGYRVQILSTRDVALADSTRDEFRVWASERIEGHEIDAYIFFRQPFYRVRVGDFRARETAIEVSSFLKNRYPDAWVVHDLIEPDRVPADTTQIRLLE
ncbi:MAG: SPOR domain-containing protein [Balneolaceae bacterium]